MLMRTILTSSLFLLIKLASGIDPPANKIQVTYQEAGSSALATTLRISVQPVDQTDCKGNKITFSVIAEGGIGAIRYLWKRKRPADAAFASFGAKDSTKLPVCDIGVGSESPKWDSISCRSERSERYTNFRNRRVDCQRNYRHCPHRRRHLYRKRGRESLVQGPYFGKCPFRLPMDQKNTDQMTGAT